MSRAASASRHSQGHIFVFVTSQFGELFWGSSGWQRRDDFQMHSRVLWVESCRPTSSYSCRPTARSNQFVVPFWRRASCPSVGGQRRRAQLNRQPVGQRDRHVGIEMSRLRYMVVERFRHGDATPVYRRFHDHGRLAPEGLAYIASWVDAQLQCCYQLMETDDASLLEQWMERWCDLVEFEVHEVITSDEAAKRVLPRP
jgi:hypothetical protein